MSDSRPRGRAQKADAPIVRHGQLKKVGPSSTILKFLGAAVVVVLVSAASLGGIVAYRLASDIGGNSGVGTAVPLDPELPPSIGAIKGGFNVLIVGSDQCETKSGCRGAGDRGSGKLNDVTMLLHVSEDQTNAVAVSFPRDLVVPYPSCKKEDGSGVTSAMAGRPINESLFYGGLGCTATVVESLTGLDIQYAGLITFNGVIALSNAVGGVPVCLTKDLSDKYTHLELSKGTHTLKGQKALDFLRSRHGIGDGSDLTRISSQQTFLSSLIRTIQSKDTLSNPTTVYKIAKAASRNMQLSTSLSSLDTMYSMALALKGLSLDKITFVQYPSLLGQGGLYLGKLAPDTEAANTLFEYIKEDKRFKLAKAGDGEGSVEDPGASDDSSTSTPDPDESDVPVIKGTGQTVSQKTCSVPN